RAVVDWLTGDPTLAPSAAELDARLTEAWDAQKLTDHGYSEDYRRIAKQLVDYFILTRHGFTRVMPSEMRLRVAGCDIVVRPDEVVTAADGARHVRAVRTGHAGSEDLKNVAAAVFTLAAHKAFPGCTVEFVYLGDAAVEAVAMKQQVLENRQETAEEMIG